MSKLSEHEERLAVQLRCKKIQFERNVKLIPGRKLEVDFFIKPNLCVEVQGQIWVKGGHNTGSGITRDCFKSCRLQLLGYRVFQVTPEQIKSGEALQWILEAIGVLER